MTLMIFDMDQTLVDFLAAHDKATRKLFKDIFNIEAWITEIDYSGNSLKTSFQLLADLKKILYELFVAKKLLLLGCYGNAFGESLPEDPEKNVLTGVRKLLGNNPGPIILSCCIRAILLKLWNMLCGSPDPDGTSDSSSTVPR